MTTLAEVRAQLDAAVERREPVETLYPIMLTMANVLDQMGYPDQAADVRASARTLLPMFGMRAETEWRSMPWWRRLIRRFKGESP
jgi:hypothetical protein